MKKLISMTDYIEDQEIEIPKLPERLKVSEMDRIFVQRVILYSRFLKQPLTLGMFIPCDLEGNVLIEPKGINYGVNVEGFRQDLHQYQQAKERVLFEGFEVTESTDEHIRIKKTELSIIFFIKIGKISFYDIFSDSHDIETIEDLVKYNLTLSENAQKSL